MKQMCFRAIVSFISVTMVAAGGDGSLNYDLRCVTDTGVNFQVANGKESYETTPGGFSAIIDINRKRNVDDERFKIDESLENDLIVESSEDSRGETTTKRNISKEGVEYLKKWYRTINNFNLKKLRRPSFRVAHSNASPFGRIVGGSEASIKQVPYLVRILMRGNHQCGGTLISLTHVLTAAHCVSWMRFRRMKVVDEAILSIEFGSTFVGKGKMIDVAKILVHPNYISSTRPASYKMDLAVLILAEEIKQSNRIPVELPNSSAINLDALENDGAPVVVAGWGSLIEGSKKSSTRLMLAYVNLVKFRECISIYHEYGLTRLKHMCAYAREKDSCQGDSGGGLYYGDTILGVVSAGIGCARAGIPGVYARVDSNMDFIYKALATSDASLQLPLYRLVFEAICFTPICLTVLLPLLKIFLIEIPF